MTPCTCDPSLRAPSASPWTCPHGNTWRLGVPGDPYCWTQTAPKMPRRVTVNCPRCPRAVELSVTTNTRLTFTEGNTGKGWLSMDVGVSAIEHVCEDR